MNKLIIIGAGGHAKVVLDIAVKNGYKDISFIDDNKKDCLGYKVLGGLDALNCLNKEKTDFVIAIGNNEVRKKIADAQKLNYVSLVHPSATIGLDVTIDVGTVVMAGAVVNPSAKIGKHAIINTGAIVEHDNIIEDFVHISPNATLGGTVTVKNSTHVGIGATVKNNISITNNVVIGAGAVVVKDIVESGVYVGVPAKLKK